MSAKEALKLKATGVKPPPLEQGERLIGKFDCMRSESCCAKPNALEPSDYQSVLCTAVICINDWAPDLPERSQSELLLGYFILPYFVLCTFLI